MPDLIILSRRSSGLPLDIQLLILEQVNDKPTLSSCSLVCAAWRVISQRRLFRKVVLLTRDPGPAYFQAFLRFIIHSTSRVGRYIKSLAIVGLRAKRSDSKGRKWQSVLSLCILRQLVSRLPKLRSLTIKGVILYFCTVEVHRNLHPRPVVDKLDISLVFSSTGDVRTLADTVSMFSEIGELWLSHLQIFELPAALDNPWLPAPVVRSLPHLFSIGSACGEFVRAMVQSFGPHLPPLTTLGLTVDRWEDLQLLACLIDDMGPAGSLLDLTLDFVSMLHPGADEFYGDDIQLHPCTTVEKLTLWLHHESELYWPGGVSPLADRFRTINAVVRSCSELLFEYAYDLPNLRSITFKVELSGLLAYETFSTLGRRRLRRSPWTALDMDLARIPTLERINIQILGPMEGVGLAHACAIDAFFAEYMPIANARRRLHHYYYDFAYMSTSGLGAITGSPCMMSEPDIY